MVRPIASRRTSVELPRENIYGHYSRLEWLRDHLDANTDHAIELGCGTAYMLTLPLRLWGYDVVGLDLDKKSVAYGQQLLRDAGLGAEAVRCEDIAVYDGPVTVVIASEVLEHMVDDVLDEALETIRTRLAPDGRLLVTIPNGYGWFELESALWFKLGLGRLIEALRVSTAVWLVKRALIGRYRDAAHPSTLASSPHVQRFTLRTICKRLEASGFEVVETRGSVLICGPFSNLLFTGFRRVMSVNVALGLRWPTFAAGFQLVAVPRSEQAPLPRPPGAKAPHAATGGR